MEFVYSVIILIIYKCIAGQSSTVIPENPVILKTLSSSDHEENVLYFSAVVNEPLDLHLQNIPTVDAWCDPYYYQDRAILDIFIIKDSNIKVKNVTNIMSTMWQCTVFVQLKKDEVLYGKRKTNLYLYIKLHVKGAKSVEFLVNGSALSFSPADLSVPYDGKTIYFYENGEQIDVVCRDPRGTGTVLLEYFEKGEMTVFYTATFGMQLHSENNNSYIDCIYGTTQPVDKYVYRVIFVTKNFKLDETPSDAQHSANLVKDSGSTSVIVGSCVGAVLVILGVMGASYWYRRTRSVQHVQIQNGEVPKQNGRPAPQQTNECQNDYDSCHYSDHLPERATYYDQPESLENSHPVDHYYTRVDYSKCKQKYGEAQVSKSEIYDEPYV